ncbi:MAG: S-layer homology domain-containing protein, partial [Firmicutes bacterium]|nr:S-layer homology domain-containing protein [Bacillota bacterium]
EDRQGDIDAWTVAIGNAITALQPKTFTVTYDACGGKMAIRSFDVVYGESFGELDQPVRTYYIFDGWYTAAEGGNLVTEDTVMTGITDLTIYAHWIQIDADYSSVEEALALITEDYELYYDESSIANIKAAVDAVEWGLGVESQKQINDWASDIRKAWNARKGKLVFVRYDANTGNVTSYGKEVRYGSTYGNLPTATHSNENYTFIGWFTEKNGGMQITPTTKVILTEDHILYARYEGMETQLADYSSVDAALGRVPADLSAYTDDSIQMLQAAINAVERDLTIDYQSTVNGWAEAINTAVDGLKLKAETIAPLDQVIGVETFVSAVYGDAPIHLNANAETTLTYEVLEGANIVNVDAFGNVTIIGAGMAKVKVTAVANEKYNAAEAIVAINVSKKSAKVTMQDVTVIEGETIEYLWTIDGFLDIDQTEIIITPKVDGNIISADVSGAKAGNYNVVVNTAVLTVLEPDYKMNCSGDESCPIYSFRDASTTAWYHDGVHYCLEKGVMNGFPEGLYKPDGEVTRAQLVVMLWRMEGSPIANYTLTFNDMDADWYKEAIRWAASEEIVKGHSEKEFAPDDPITREQLAAIFQRYASYKGYTVTERASLSSYVDAANVSSWAKDAVEWSVAVGLINGKSATELAPQDTATRAQAATMVYRFCEVIF